MTNLPSRLFQTIALIAASLIFTSAAHAAPKVGDRFGDWVFSCAALAENKTACALTQTILSKKDNRRLVKFSLERIEKKNSLLLTAVIPLGIDLTAEVNGTIDKGHPFKFTLGTCLQFGCIATYVVDSSFLKSLQTGQTLNVSFTGSGGNKPFTVAGSLNGLSEGLKATNIN